jgi:hypothetical protein
MPNDPNASNPKLRCIFVTVVWGDWHRTIFLDANLPTMLAPGNLPALAAGIDCQYLIYTTPQDAVCIARDATFQRMQSTVPTSFRLFRPSKTKNIITLHHEVWRTATEYARKLGAFILFMPPDVAWADGSFATLRSALEAGKRALFMTYPRVISETIVSDLAARFPQRPDGALVIKPRDMMALAIRHIHPLMAASERATEHFSVHPEMIIWPVRGGGFLARLLARELFCFKPGHYELNSQSLLAQLPPEDEIHAFDDSDSFLAISFTPCWKDMEWYLARRALEPLFVGRWWIYYDSPINDRLSAINFRYRCGTADEASWRLTESRADALLAHLRSAREFVRVVETLSRMGHSRAAAFLASALRVHGLARRWPLRGPFLLLAPSDQAFARSGFGCVPGDGVKAAEVRRLIKAHVAIIDRQTKLHDDQEVKTLARQVVRLQNTGRVEFCGNNIILPVDELYAAPLAQHAERTLLEDHTA